MKTEVSPHYVRDLVSRTFADLGAPDDKIENMRDTILIRDGSYYGRSFRAAGLMAMWMIDINLLSFYRADGVIVRTIDLREAGESQRHAA